MGEQSGLELRILSGLHRGASLPLGGERYVIGSSDDADVVLLDPGVADRHATLRHDGERWLLAALEGACALPARTRSWRSTTWRLATACVSARCGSAFPVRWRRGASRRQRRQPALPALVPAPSQARVRGLRRRSLQRQLQQRRNGAAAPCGCRWPPAPCWLALRRWPSAPGRRRRLPCLRRPRWQWCRKCPSRHRQAWPKPSASGWPKWTCCAASNCSSTKANGA